EEPSTVSVSTVSESNAEAELEFALLEHRSGVRSRELIGIGRNRARRIAERIHRLCRDDAPQLLGIERVLQFGIQLDAHGAAHRKPSRIAKIDVLPRRPIPRVPRNRERTIAG